MLPDFTDALCFSEKVPTELFFGAEHETSSERDLRIKVAKSICAKCPIQSDCLAWAIHNDERGVWGGTTEQERLRSTDAMPTHEPPTPTTEWLKVAEHDGVVLRKTRDKLNRRWEVVVDELPRFSHSLESEGWIAWNRWVEARMRP